MVESSELVIEKAWVCSGAAMAWRPRSTPMIEAYRVDGAFVPDGRLSDPAWETAPALELRKASLVDFKMRSELRFLFDDEHLYLGFAADGPPVEHALTGDSKEEERRIAAEMNAKEVASATSKRDPDIPGVHELYHPDVKQKEYLSLLIDAGADGRGLVEFLVNSSGDRDSTRYTRTGRAAYWNGRFTGTREAGKDRPTALKGSGFWSINDFDQGSWQCWTEVGEAGWSACLAVPYSLLGHGPSQGDVWHFNACRHTHGDRSMRYFASPHPDMYQDHTKFAQLLFGPNSVVPVSADLGRRVPGSRVAELNISLAQDVPIKVTGSIQLDGEHAGVPSRETLDLIPEEVGTLSFDLDVGKRPPSKLTFTLTDDKGVGLYRSEPIDVRLPEPVREQAVSLSREASAGYSLVVADGERPIPWDGESPGGSSEISLACHRREHGAFQIGIIPQRVPLRNIRVEASDLSGPEGATIPANAVEWFVEGKLHREPNPASMILRREFPDHQVRWVPDVLMPVEAFAIDGQWPETMWVEVTVPAEASLGKYSGHITVHVDGLEPRTVAIDLRVQGFAGEHDLDDVLDVGSTKQVLIDDYIVGHIDGASIRYHAFKKHPRNPLIVPDRPADLIDLGLYGTILRSAAGGFRMWYTSHSLGDYGVRYHVHYAEADDGLTWTKPDLEAIEFNGTKKNNLVDLGTGVHVIYRPDIPDPDRRYVRYVQYATRGTFASYSPDGIHWSRDSTPLFIGSDAASPTYDPRTGRYYVVSIEDRAIGAFVRRSPAFSVSADGRKWSQFRPALWADARDDRIAFRNLSRVRNVLSYDYPDHFHAEFNDVKPYPYAGLYLASVNMFECSGADIYKGTQGGQGNGKDDCATHLQLVSSRSSDLSEWQRAGPREPIIDRGMRGEWDSGFISAADFPLVVGDELWLYYGGVSHTQQYQSCQAFTGSAMKQGDVATGIGLATMRLDGFVSLDAGAEPGRLTTKKLRFSGKRLEVNAAVRGNLRVAVLDKEGHPLPGLSESECQPLMGDSVRHVVRWHDQPDLRQTDGQPVRLAFHLQDAELYAFQFVG